MLKPLRIALRVLVWSALVGGLGCLLYLSPPGVHLEEDLGLKGLFLARGVREAPRQLVVINLDRSISHLLDLPEEPADWPRKVYAELVDRLVQQQVALIGLNVLLKGPGDPADDATLAKAMDESGRVVVTSNLRRDHVLAYRTATELVGTLMIDTPDELPPAFADHVLGAAPFPIPRHVSLTKHFWAYMEEDPTDVTFPVAMLRAHFVHNAYADLVPLLAQLDPPEPQAAEQENGPKAKRMLSERLTTELAIHPEFAAAVNHILEAQGVPQFVRNLGKSWMECCPDGDQIRFNHYGPPGTIPTYSATRLLGPEGPHGVDLRDKIVLVGYSEDLQPELNHGFYTDFSRSPKDAMSSVEMAAAAFGNLLDGSGIKSLPKPFQLGIVLGWALLVCAIAVIGLSGRSLLLILGLGAGYMGLVYVEFSRAHLWLPYVIPLWVQTPAVLIVAAVSRYHAVKREKQKVCEAFGLYVPESVVERMMREGRGPHAGQGIVINRGVCFYSDAGQYTRVAEELEPMSLGLFMNQYYDTIFPLVKGEGGFISDVVGDSVLALWAGEGDPEAEYRAACRCALAVRNAVATFCRLHQVELPIRIGINAGPFRLGNVGTRERLEYRASGDTVNTASRMENLCKQLGTSILLAEEIGKHASGFITRNLGTFLLEGKSRSVTVRELLGAEGDPASAELHRLCGNFAKGLASFRQGDLATAQSILQRLLHDHPADGPTLFYLAEIEHMREVPEDRRDTRVVTLGKS